MNEETLSDYEQQQINQLIQQQFSSQKLDEYHQEKVKQDREYERALKLDQMKEQVAKEVKKEFAKEVAKDDFDEPSIDEVRRIRLLRFDQSNKYDKDSNYFKIVHR